MSKDCFGSYKNEGECMVCALPFPCIDTTIAVDRWYDERAEEQEEIERWLEDHLDAKYLDVLTRQRGISF